MGLGLSQIRGGARKKSHPVDIYIFFYHPPQKKISVLWSASGERFIVSRMRDFFLFFLFKKKICLCERQCSLKIIWNINIGSPFLARKVKGLVTAKHCEDQHSVAVLKCKVGEPSWSALSRSPETRLITNNTICTRGNILLALNLPHPKKLHCLVIILGEKVDFFYVLCIYFFSFRHF